MKRALRRLFAPPLQPALQRDEVAMLLSDTLLPDWAGMERLLDRLEHREVRP